MAAENEAPYLRHELISPNTPSSSNPASYSPQTSGFSHFPLKWFPQYEVISKFNDECSIHLRAELSPKSEDPFISVHFSLIDHTKLLQISSGRHVTYFFDCPLTDKHFVRGYAIKASQFFPLKIITDDYPVKREHISFFEIEIYQFTKELLEYANGDICIAAEASIDSIVLPGEAAVIVEEMEGEGFREDSCGDLECYDCAVCLDEVRLRWFQGMRLPCSHVFHVKCISCWFDKKTSCPMCRQELLWIN